jgi:hypothetical protein
MPREADAAAEVEEAMALLRCAFRRLAAPPHPARPEIGRALWLLASPIARLRATPAPPPEADRRDPVEDVPPLLPSPHGRRR